MSETNLTPPVVTGTLEVGEILHTTDGTWDFDLDYLTFAYVWLRCDADGSNPVAITGATDRNYQLVNADIGHAIRSRVTATEHSFSAAPLPVPSNGIITAGGTYGGTHNGQITIATTAPVTLDGLVQNYTAATMIKTSVGTPPDLTLVNSRLTGGSWRILDCDAFSSFTMEHCTIIKTAGVTLVGDGDVLVRYNRHTNIQRVQGGVGNFIQLRILQSGTVEIAWNEIVNEYNLSNPEDVISIYHSSGTWIHDNMIWGTFVPGNASVSSQGGITVDTYNADANPANDNLIEDNQVVKGMGIVIAIEGPELVNGNSVLNNRIVSSGLLTDNVTKSFVGYEGTHIVAGSGSNAPAVADNHAHGNVVGYMQGTRHGANRQDGRFDGCPEGDAGEWANNTHLAPIGGTITTAHEDAEWDLWQDKLVDNAVTIGAP